MAKYTPIRYKQVVSELKQANNTIKRLREANEFKRGEIEIYKSHYKAPWFLVAILSSVLIWSLFL